MRPYYIYSVDYTFIGTYFLDTKFSVYMYQQMSQRPGHANISIHISLSSASVTEHAQWKAIQISTVDAFQGGEKGLIILSCVKTNSTGFMDNDK